LLLLLLLLLLLELLQSVDAARHDSWTSCAALTQLAQWLACTSCHGSSSSRRACIQAA
jgi:cytochrome c-type biogenesis protein CcmH/NrfF